MAAKGAWDTMRTCLYQARCDGSSQQSAVGNQQRLRGFTLVEVVTAIAVFAVLTALLLPAASYVRNRIQTSRMRIIEVNIVHNEVQKYLVTGDVSESAIAAEKPGSIEIRLAKPEATFSIEAPR